MKKSLLFGICTVLIWAGCESNDMTESPPETGERVIYTNQFNYDELEGVSPEAREEAIALTRQAVSDVVGDVLRNSDRMYRSDRDLYIRDDELAFFDTKMRAFRDQHQEDPALPIIDQEIAIPALDQHLMNAAVEDVISPERKALIYAYTRMLIEAKSPDIRVLSTSLVASKEYWDEEELLDAIDYVIELEREQASKASHSLQQLPEFLKESRLRNEEVARAALNELKAMQRALTTQP